MNLELYDLMAEDHIIYATLEKNGEITTTVRRDGDQDHVVYRETSHEAAWDSLVYFARQVLEEDMKINELRKMREDAYADTI